MISAPLLTAAVMIRSAARVDALAGAHRRVDDHGRDRRCGGGDGRWRRRGCRRRWRLRCARLDFAVEGEAVADDRRFHLRRGAAHCHRIQAHRAQQRDQRRPVERGARFLVQRADVDYREFMVEKIGDAAGHLAQRGLQVGRLGVVQDGADGHHGGNFDFDRLAGRFFGHDNQVGATLSRGMPAGRKAAPVHYIFGGGATAGAPLRAAATSWRLYRAGCRSWRPQAARRRLFTPRPAF